MKVIYGPTIKELVDEELDVAQAARRGVNRIEMSMEEYRDFMDSAASLITNRQDGAVAKSCLYRGVGIRAHVDYISTTERVGRTK